MRTARMALALIGLCGLALGQNINGGSISSTWVTDTVPTGTFTIGGSGTIWAGSNEIETRSLKAPSVSLREVKSTAHKISLSQIPTASYMKTAKAINLKSPAIDEAKLAQIIVGHGFSIYEYAKVDNYLYHEALKQGTNMRWVWKPMRDSDSKASASEAWQTFDGMGRISAGSVYAKAIPERVLERAECLLAELPDAIFFVSDYEVQRPDPFLAVSTPRMLQAHRIFIVDQWDEPGFTDKPIVKPYDEDKALQKYPGFVFGTPTTKTRAQSLAGN